MPQSLSKIYIHIIFSTKNRKRFIRKEVKTELYSYIAKILQEIGSQPTIIGGVEDHIHILMQLSKTLSLSKHIEEIKKSSSKWIKQKADYLKDFQWQAGYGAFSVGQSQLTQVKKYIQGQEEHHKKVSFEDELRLFLKSYHVEFDEKYLWD